MQKNKTLGILGGGQLGRMFCQSAQAMGFHVCVLDPSTKNLSPTAAIADIHIQAHYDDLAALDYMSNICVAISSEFENVPANTIEYINQHNCFICPNANAVSIAQNRQKEKQFFQNLGIECAPFYIINNTEDLENLTPNSIPNDFFPSIIKTCQLGYDGKGQIQVANIAEASDAWHKLNQVPCILEKKINIFNEISVILVRDRFGNIATYPIGQNIHKNGILYSSTVPSPNTSINLAEQAYNTSKKIATALDYVGVLCVEYFVLENETLYANEIASRPHNSGHYTIDACITSQFEQQVRILANLPLGSTKQHTPVVMLNLLGNTWIKNDDIIDGIYNDPNWSGILQNGNAKLHLYGKFEPKIGRKMGHINCLADTVKQAQNIASAIEILL